MLRQERRSASVSERVKRDRLISIDCNNGVATYFAPVAEILEHEAKVKQLTAQLEGFRADNARLQEQIKRQAQTIIDSDKKISHLERTIVAKEAGWETPPVPYKLTCTPRTVILENKSGISYMFTDPAKVELTFC